ncbi:MAG: diacylglycerol kinase family protein [Bacilli bacterium]|nr:diacylglycerol kinase family protein [Bacilli bacterium]
MTYTLYNSLANNKREPEYVVELRKKGKSENIIDVTKIDYKVFFNSINPNDVIYLVGGDGNINYLANAIDIEKFKNEIYLIPSGTGNDFFHDVTEGKEVDKVLLNPYLKDLPTVEVNGIKKKFINGIGFGIDGYCCEVGDKLKEKSTKKINYTSIAIKGLLFHFKPVRAKVIVDGNTYEHTKVWLTPTMKGRYYGGGMKIAPNQDRNEKGKVSAVVYRAPNKFKALMVFPSIFKGEHIKKTKMVKVYEGHEITVVFNKPTALQIDGETVKNVLTYTVRG